MLFRVLTADPAWQHEDQLPGPKRGAGKNYLTMPTHEIARVKLPSLERTSWLFLWRLSSMVEDAMKVCWAWGFEPKSEIVWRKLTKNGEDWFGMGRYVRAAHETCIIATRGPTPSSLRKTKAMRSMFEAPMPVKPDGTYWHSAKPEVFYTQIIPELVDGPYYELFARTRRPGWTQEGLELQTLAPDVVSFF